MSARARSREAAVWQTLAAKERLCDELDSLVRSSPGVAEAAKRSAAAHERWMALPPLSPAWERKMIVRRDAALRALSEAGGHFLLGAAHSLGNLGLRIALLDEQAALAVQAAHPRADFRPGSDDRKAWLTLSVSSRTLAAAAGASANVPLGRIAAAVSGLAGDPFLVALDSRRGMDYHRLRPQSVPHASPRRGVSQAGDGYITIDLPAPVLDPEADADRVYQILTDAMEPVRHAMLAIRNDLGKAVRAAGLWYHQPPPRPAAARTSRPA